MNTDTGKILIGISLIMVSMAMMISPSQAAVPGASFDPGLQGMVISQDPGAYPGYTGGSGAIAPALLPQQIGNYPSSPQECSRSGQ